MSQIDQRITKAEQKLHEAQERLKQAKALKQKQQARKRATLAKAERAADTRRKVLVGAFILEQLERASVSPVLLTYESGRFSEWLTRPHDRALFGLHPLAANSPQSVAPEPQHADQ